MKVTDQQEADFLIWLGFRHEVDDNGTYTFDNSNGQTERALGVFRALVDLRSRGVPMERIAAYLSR